MSDNSVSFPDSKQLAGKYDGETVFLIAPGPSLQYVDFDQLSDEFTFGFNTLQMIYEETEWRPTFYMNGHNLRTRELYESVKQNLNGDTICFIDADKDHDEVVKELQGPVYNMDNRGQRRPKSDDEVEQIARQYWNADRPEEGIHAFATTMGAAAQMCGILGFTQIVLLGADLYRQSPIKTRITRRGDDPGQWLIRRNQDHAWDLEPIADGLKQSEHPVATGLNMVYYALLTKILERIPTRSVNHYDPEYSDHHGLDYASRNRLYRREYDVIREGCARTDIDLQNATLINRFDEIPTYTQKWDLYDC